MAYTEMFLETIAAYRLELGEAFPSADQNSVLLVLRECNRPEAKSQMEIEQAAGISQSNAAKLLSKMIVRGWLEASNRNPKTAKKKYHISLLGVGVLSKFEENCRRAAKNASKAKVSRS
jgi:DNA-binding MarR family transcriptional regulator